MNRARHLLQSSTLVILFFALDKVIGLARTLLIGRAFGTGADYDAFTAANQLPEVFVTLISGGALAAAFIPVYSAHLNSPKAQAAARVANAILTLVLIVLGLVSAIGAIFAPWLTRVLLVPDFPVELQQLTADLMRIILLQTTLFGISGVLSSILNAHQHFALPALAFTWEWTEVAQHYLIPLMPAAYALAGIGVAAALGRLDLAAMLSGGGPIFGPPIASLPYLIGVSPLLSPDGTMGILLFRSVAEELRIVRGIRQSMVGIGLFALLQALLLALVVARIVARPAQVLARAATDLAQGSFDAPLPRPSGDEIGQLTRAFGEMRSAIAERENRLRSAQAELIHREKLAAMGRLVAQLSHEINNPINNIQNCLEVLDRRGDPDDPNREFLDLAREELQRMAVLTRQLLDQSRPLADSARPLHLNHLVQRVAALARTRIEDQGIELRMRFDPELPTVVAHPDAIQQVLANLVDNAVDAMPDGGVLTLRTLAGRDTVNVEVEDSGSGIASDDLPHIFEAFYTTKPEVRGIGLGLFVSDGIVRGHRGRLSVDSVPGRGSRFTMQLPRETLGVPAAAPEHDPHAAAGA